MEFRKIIIIGVAPGELAGNLSKGHQAVLTHPAMKRDELTDALIEDPIGGISKVVDAKGADVTYPRFGCRPPGEFGRDDPGDEGRETVRLRVAFWLPVAPGRNVALPKFDRAGNELASWTVPTKVANATDEEVAALRAGVLIERVEDEAGGQRFVDEGADPEDGPDTNTVLLEMWAAMVAELAVPTIHGSKAIPNHPLVGASVDGKNPLILKV